MAQTKVTKYFSARKNATFGDSVSQKRKLDSVLPTENTSASFALPTTRRTSKRRKADFPVKPVQIKTPEIISPERTCVKTDEIMVTQSQQKSKEKLDVSKIKERLSKCSKLSDLKAQLSAMNQNLAQVKQTRSTRQNAKVAVETEPEQKTVVGEEKLAVTKKRAPRKTAAEKKTVEARGEDTNKTTDDSPTEKASEKTPAYQKYASLAAPGPPSLTLPYKYRQLLETYSSVDTVVSMLHNRSEICTFSKLKAAVQRMSNRNFEEENLGQIKTVYPAAYVLRQERNVPGEKPGYQLTVEANLHENDPTPDPTSEHTHFSLTHITRRKHHFHNSLLAEAKRHHKAFLSSLPSPLSVSGDKLARWHPQFAVDQIADIPASPLPRPPTVKTFSTARDVLQASQNNFIPRVEAALSKVALQSPVKQPPPPSLSPDVKSAVKKAPPTPKLDAVLNGIPTSLLEKIRQKEAANLERSMQRNSADERRLHALKRLPDVIRRVRGTFITEKKPALPKPLLIQKLSQSSHSQSKGEAEENIKTLLEVLPNWLTLVTIKKGEYIKMNRAIELRALEDTINALIKAKQ